MELQNENIDLIKGRIAETEAEINRLTEEINGMAEEKEKLKTNYEETKAEFENFKSDYTEKSTSGLYFLVVTAIVFVVILVMVLDHEIVSFFLYPATALLVVAIILKLIGGAKFRKLKASFDTQVKNYDDAKNSYDEFMKKYNELESQLEKKQYEWESIENDRIEARKLEWEAKHKSVAAN